MPKIINKPEIQKAEEIRNLEVMFEVMDNTCQKKPNKNI
jgi:hypothetical protein